MNAASDPAQAKRNQHVEERRHTERRTDGPPRTGRNVTRSRRRSTRDCARGSGLDGKTDRSAERPRAATDRAPNVKYYLSECERARARTTQPHRTTSHRPAESRTKRRQPNGADAMPRRAGRVPKKRSLTLELSGRCRVPHDSATARRSGPLERIVSFHGAGASSWDARLSSMLATTYEGPTATVVGNV